MKLYVFTTLAFYLALIPPLDAEHQQPFSFFNDLQLTYGFRLSAVRSSFSPNEVKNIFVADDSQTPLWRLAQWGTRFSLESAEEQVLPDGTRILENEGKTVKILPGGLAGEGVYLQVNGGAEYGDRLRQYGEAWPHLLIEQKLHARPFAEFTAVPFTVEFRVEKCDAATDTPMDNGLHTAHITAFWTVHNINKSSKDHNNMIWFGVPLYDVRYPNPRGHQALDVGQADATGKFICTIPGVRFFDEPIAIGNWYALSCDLAPLIQEALAASQAKGFLTDTKYEDLAATSFNLGWEVPGTYDCGITLRNLSLRGNK